MLLNAEETIVVDGERGQQLPKHDRGEENGAAKPNDHDQRQGNDRRAEHATVQIHHGPLVS